MKFRRETNDVAENTGEENKMKMIFFYTAIFIYGMSCSTLAILLDKLSSKTQKEKVK